MWNLLPWIISCVVELKGGGAIETGMIGASQALDDKVSHNHVVTRWPAGHLLLHPTGSDELPVFRGLLVKYNQFFLSQVQQTAACNAKCLLRMHEIAGPDLLLTQEFLAQIWACDDPASRVCRRRSVESRHDILCPRQSSHYLGQRRHWPADATTTSVRTIEGSSSRTKVLIRPGCPSKNMDPGG